MSETAAQPVTGTETTKQASDKLSIMMFSGTADKFIPLGVLAAGRRRPWGCEVNIFVTGFALLRFTKEHHDLPFPAEFAAMAPALVKGMRGEPNVASWDTMLRQGQGAGRQGVRLLDDERRHGAEARRLQRPRR